MKSKMKKITVLLWIVIWTFAGFELVSAGQNSNDPSGEKTLTDKVSRKKGLPVAKAFPGAEGFAADATGGRGGDVYIVTNLNDAGPGSLREAVEASGPRTVVFAVSGIIELQSTLAITNGDITIAGQTAPGDGICLKNYSLSIYNVENVIVRYISSRLGVDRRVEGDAVNGRFANNVIIDHCSFSWSVDETVGNYDNYEMTVQWCIISESLHDSYHSQGPHGMGAFIGGTGFSFHHNLLANHYNRTPRLCGARYDSDPELEMVDSRNNVIFNWITSSCYGGEGGDYNIMNNYYKPGPATYSSVERRIVAPRDYNGMWGEFYVSGNYVEGYPDVTADNSKGIDEVPEELWDSVIADQPFDAAPVTTQTPHEAYLEVLKHAGASLPKRDQVDARATEDTRTGIPRYGANYPGIINHPSNVGGYPELRSTTPPTDTDKDGMPDEWEDANGLDKNDPEDGKIIRADGYSNLEHYLNSLVGDFRYMLRPMEVEAAVDDKTVALTWTDLSDKEEGFILERADGDGDFVQIADLATDTESYTDATIEEYGLYTYRLKAYNSEMETCFTEGLEVDVADPDPPRYKVTVSVEGSGSVVLNPDGGEYVTGTEVVLLASPASGWEFDGWSGDLTGNDNPVELVVDEDKNVTATFSSISRLPEYAQNKGGLKIYPNPLNDKGEIFFTLDKPDKIVIHLYDLQGKMIRQLVNNHYPAGVYRFALDGSAIGAGAYIVSLRTEIRLNRELIIVY